MPKDHETNESGEPNLTAVVEPAPVESQSPPLLKQLRLSLKPNTLIKARDALVRSFKRPSPTSFRFNDLPVEIRLQIWEAAIVPRVHELHPCAKLYNERMTFRSNASITPSIFHVCQESRAVALKHYELMSYEPPALGRSNTRKGILRFYFCPDLDILLLNSLMGLFIMFMLMDSEEDYDTVGIMKGWKRVAFDAERAQLIGLLSGLPARRLGPPRFKAVFPSLQELIIAFDYSSKGKTRFRTSVWPGENGTSLKELNLPTPLNNEVVDSIFSPMKQYLEDDYEEPVPAIGFARVRRKRFIRGDLRYAVRKTCSLFGLRPRGIFRLL